MKNIIFNKKIKIDKDININIKNFYIEILGKYGFNNFNYNKILNINIKNNYINIEKNNEFFSKILNLKSIINTTYKIINNNIYGVKYRYEKKLIIFGIGYKANLINNILNLHLGYSKVIKYKIPDNIEVICNNENEITIFGTDKKIVGNISYIIRNFRKPDSYKGKGIRYNDEKIFIKESKKVK